MAQFDITSPDGKKYRINAPDGATQDEVLAYAQSQFTNQQASQTPQEAPAQQRSVGQELGRQVGLTGRYALEGIGGALDFLSSPIRAGLNTLGANIQPGIGKTLADAAGLPNPETATERVIGEASRFAAGSAIPLAGANRLASIGQGSAQSVGQQLAQRPAAQISSAGISGGADQFTGELGGSDATRAGVSLAAGIATPFAFDRTQQATRAATDLAGRVGAAREVGYVVPPTQARPTLTNRLLEGTAGKISTSQNASARNQMITNRIVAEDIGLPPNVPINPESLSAIRANAGQAYEALAELPPRAAVRADSLTNTPAISAFNPREELLNLRRARSDADSWYAAYARSARPDDQEKARAAKALATRIENEFEKYAASLGRDDLLPALREARTLIAKTHAVEAAYNPSTGNVDAKKLAKRIQQGKPITGGMRQAGQFAGDFPTAARTPESMGSIPGMSPLDVTAAAGLSGLTGNPLMMATVAARPTARALSLSPMVQNRLAIPMRQSTPLSTRAALPIGTVIGIQNE